MLDSVQLRGSFPSVEIGSQVQPVQTVNPASAAPEDKFTYVDLSAIDQASKVISGARQLPGAEAPSRARQVIRSGDVLVSTVRPNLNGVAIVPPELDEAIASTGFCVLSPNREQLDTSYLFHWVRSPAFIEEMVRQATGASYPAVTDRIVRKSLIPLPSLPEQRRIAAILDEADALRAKRRAALAQLDEMARAIFVEMFGDPAANQRSWPLRKVGSLALRFSDGPFGSNLKSSHYVDSGVRVVRLQNIGSGKFVDNDQAYISEEHFKSLSRHECRPGDVLIGTLGDPNLRACIQPKWLKIALNKADCVQMRVDPDQADGEFICALLNHPSTEIMAQDRIVGQTRLRISMGRLREMSVPVPPLPLQLEFGRRVSALKQVERAYASAVADSDALFSSLQHRAFRGEL